MQAKRFAVPVAVIMTAAVALGAWWFTTRHSATPEIVEGWAMPNASGTAISLHDSDDTSRNNSSYIVVGAWWADHRNAWHDGTAGPTCVGTDPTSKKRVRLGIVEALAAEDGIGGPRVVWLRCL